MQGRIFQSSAKFIHSKDQKTNLVYLYINLVETFALILNSKIVFKYLLWLKLSILKNTLHVKNKHTHILKNRPAPFSYRFKYVLSFLSPIIKGLRS